VNLGRLEKIDDLRNTWLDEARNFTPWMAETENLSILSDALGLGSDGLELEAVEKFVGPYRADILCRNTADGAWVLIENQLERTDHNHLGQIIVYAAGLGATTIVWVSKQVSPEHKAALEWLNTISDGGPSFFAVEIELWRIGESPLAPRFNIVVSPNDWTRSAASAKKGLEENEISDTRRMQRSYWAAVEAKVAERGGPLNPVSPPAQSWLTHGIGKTGVGLGMAMHNWEKWIRVEVYLGGKFAKIWFAQLLTHKQEIETALCVSLEWQELPERQDCRICLYSRDSDPWKEADWARQHTWLVNSAVRFHQVFRPFIAKLTNEHPNEKLGQT
jgi:hypothetical protein